MQCSHTHHKLRQFVEILHQTIYNIKMKWEPTGVHADWCDTRPFSAPTMNMTPRGTLHRCPTASHHTVGSMARQVVPKLPHSAGFYDPSPRGEELHPIWLPLSPNPQCTDRCQGCGYKHYQWRWWWQNIRVRFKAGGLLDVILLHRVRERCTQGRTWAGQGGSSNHRVETI